LRFNDAITGAVLLVLAIAIVGYASTFPRVIGDEYGPGFFPMVLGTALGLSAVALIVSGLRHWHGRPRVELAAYWHEPRRVAYALSVPIGGLAYILLVNRLGFLVTAAGLLFLLLLLYTRRPAAAAIVAVVMALGIHAVFAGILSVPLPWGVLRPIAWTW